MSQRFKGITITPDGNGFKGQEFSKALGIRALRVVIDGKETVQELDDKDTYMNFVASFPLFLIREAWGMGCSFEAEADGYGPGRGTHGDWSGIRDSSDEATNAMLEKALNFLFLPRQI